MNEISALVNETIESALAPSLMGSRREKMAVFEPESRPSPYMTPAGVLVLDLLASVL